MAHLISYNLSTGGKRIRPLITLAFGEDLGINSDKLISVACAIELLHMASLIHDDLPSIDNDDYRRGKPTCHVKFDEASAVLVGDFLPLLAVELITGSNFDNAEKVCMQGLLARAYMDLCQGQLLDVRKTRVESSFDSRLITELKTGALFKLAFQFGAIKEKNIFEISGELGLAFGSIFQRIDDITDNESHDNEEKENLKHLENEREIFYSRLIKAENAAGKKLLITRELTKSIFG